MQPRGLEHAKSDDLIQSALLAQDIVLDSKASDPAETQIGG